MKLKAKIIVTLLILISFRGYSQLMLADAMNISNNIIDAFPTDTSHLVKVNNNLRITGYLLQTFSWDQFKQDGIIVDKMIFKDAIDDKVNEQLTVSIMSPAKNIPGTLKIVIDITSDSILQYAKWEKDILSDPNYVILNQSPFNIVAEMKNAANLYIVSIGIPVSVVQTTPGSFQGTKTDVSTGNYHLNFERNVPINVH